MDFIKWTEQYSTGNALVDAYHHIFFQMVQEFGQSMNEEGAPPMEDRIGFLVDYTFMHFESEERLMEKAGYGDLDHHRDVHKFFRDKVQAIHRQYRENPESVQAEEVLSLVQDWFAHHILGEDLKFKTCLKDRA